MSRRKVADLSADLGTRAENFCRYYFPEGRKQGNYWQISDTTGAAGQSLSIRLQAQEGRKAGGWTDYQSGEYGDLIDLLHAKLGSLSLKDTLKEAQSFLGDAPCPINHDAARSRAQTEVASTKRIARARKLFSYGRPVLGTAAASYLQSRGVTRLGPALRFYPKVFLHRGEGAPPEQCPALLAKITDNRGQTTGCARTYLDPSTGGIADIVSPKRMLGQLHGNAVRFWSGSDCANLIVGEGLENTLSVGTALPEFDLASCLTATHLGLFIPPIDVERIWIARDNDEAGEHAASRLRTRLASQGVIVADLVPRLGDFNDDLLAYGKDALRQALLLAIKKQGLGDVEG